MEQASTKFPFGAPYTNFYPNAGMKILPESKLSGYQGFDLEESETGIAKGSKNISRYLYKSKYVKLTDDQINKLEAPEVNIGQYLVIPQMSFHESALNESAGTRFSAVFDFVIRTLLMIDAPCINV